MSQKDFEMTRSFMVDQAPVVDFSLPDASPTEEAAAQANAKRLGLPYVDLKRHDLHPQSIKLLTEA